MTDAATLTRALGGKWYGSYGLAFCPAHRNTLTPALSLADGGGTRLLLTCHAGCTFGEIWSALPDGDAPGKAAAHALAERASGLGWHVSLLPAPDGRDWNDIVQARAVA